MLRMALLIYMNRIVHELSSHHWTLQKSIVNTIWETIEVLAHTEKQGLLTLILYPYYPIQN